jgi:hypothetical protein
MDRSRLTYVQVADAAITHDPSLKFQKVPRGNQGETVANYQQWFVTDHVREKFSCRSCETITQPPAPFHVIQVEVFGLNCHDFSIRSLARFGI